MVITVNDVNNDIKMLTDSLKDKQRPLVSPVKALWMSMRLPMACLLAYAVALCWILLTFEAPKDPFYDSIDPYFHYLGANIAASAICLLFAFFIGFGLYGPSLAYLSIPEEIRAKSLILNRLRALVFKSGIAVFMFNAILAAVACVYPDAICASPVLFIISFIVMQSIISAEMTRYGVSSVMSKLTKMVNKI
ncbi:hypothetical protein G9X52_01815 [Cronobacter sakazakii]|uniref:Conjugal transfer protein TraS n=1 Tax=Franconibacter pulveris TaxID=435910 RepID=A0A0J8VLP4_9ENTR|nr:MULTISPECIES: hypothetical protein [Enterobacteriaceae]EGT5763994.1 hypothetical protein [Cronobacter sakazakii]EJG0761792.1 hypothetical protein [Cronobacter sakazakii]EJJ0549417.1 hypothetical protein [Cronobacter sakazakii]ELQ6035296.1 hypothetical protein [Cronobacter sakazakii]ELQ6043832.1 hypothetical protein [Cronobacter sakazakii]